MTLWGFEVAVDGEGEDRIRRESGAMNWGSEDKRKIWVQGTFRRQSGQLDDKLSGLSSSVV